MDHSNSVTTHVTGTIITAATNAVDNYKSTINGLNKNLSEVLNTLKNVATFEGKASDGYQFFYNDKVLPAITTNLINPEKSLTASITGYLNAVKQNLIDTVDPGLGDGNKSVGSEEPPAVK